MTILVSNVYAIGNDGGLQHLLTGVIGAFSTRELAMKAWNGKLKEVGVPNSELAWYKPDIAGRTTFRVGEDGKYVDGYIGSYMMEFMSIDTEMNKVLGSEDSTLLEYAN